MSRRFDQGNTPETDGTALADTIQFGPIIDLHFGEDTPTEHPSVPALKSPHPDPAMASKGVILDRKRAEWVNDTTAFVTCSYSNDGRFRFTPRPPEPEPGFADWQFSFTRTTRRVPRYVRTQIVYTDQDAGSVATRYQWEPEPFDEPSYEFVVARSVTVTTFPFSALSAIRSQAGKLHSIGLGNQPWLFEPGAVRRDAAELWTINYTWTQPAELPAFGNGPGYPVVTDQNGGSFSTAEIIVPAFRLLPFWDYTVSPSTDFEDPPNIWAEQRGDRTSLNGFRSLPGTPIP